MVLCEYTSIIERKYSYVINLNKYKYLLYRNSGPFAVLMSFLSEFHGIKHRSRVLMNCGIYFSFGHLTLPLLAWAILPHSFNLVIIEEYLGN